MSIKNNINLYLFIVIVAIIGVLNFFNYRFKENLLAEYEVGAAQVVSLGKRVGKNLEKPSYVYTVEGVAYKGTFRSNAICYDLSSQDLELLKSIEIPIIYSKERHEVSKALLSSSDCHKYLVGRTQEQIFIMKMIFDC